ncbi:molecular chaperone DnaJ [Rhodanobacter thiooxydans LCS2]|nr:DnaJ domain-containing protein [Rhodanobacter thiooxydans]EIM03314.1 molecular chaperone DnaJ [Rhodanobacter thiooxydans LCS2]
MDPYGVLGIRPSAGRDEIELAYKGRRSQYHPDRYAQSDAETQAWATGKMQEINQAYAVVSDPEARFRFDRAQAHEPVRPEPPPQAAPTPRATLKDALQGLAFNAASPFERVFVAPHIPLKKLRGALGSYGHDLRPQDVVALIDDTFFGGAREGVLITEAQIRYKATPFDSTDTRLLGCLSAITAKGKYVYIQDERYAVLNMPDQRDLKLLFEAVARYLQVRS